MSDNYYLITNEGAAAVEEAIEYLKNAEPMGTLEWKSGMSKACQFHVEDQGPDGLTGHTSTDGSKSFDRMNRYGTWGGSAGENISYG